MLHSSRGTRRGKVEPGDAGGVAGMGGRRARRSLLPEALAVLAGAIVLAASGAPQVVAQAPEPGPDPTGVQGELRLHADGRLEVLLLIAEGAEVPPSLSTRLESGEPRRSFRGPVEVLAWEVGGEEEALDLLREGREADEAFGLRVLMAPGAVFEDLWEFQARLSQIGVRRVQIVTGAVFEGT